MYPFLCFTPQDGCFPRTPPEPHPRPLPAPRRPPRSPCPTARSPSLPSSPPVRWVMPHRSGFPSSHWMGWRSQTSGSDLLGKQCHLGAESYERKMKWGSASVLLTSVFNNCTLVYLGVFFIYIGMLNMGAQLLKKYMILLDRSIVFRRRGKGFSLIYYLESRYIALLMSHCLHYVMLFLHTFSYPFNFLRKRYNFTDFHQARGFLFFYSKAYLKGAVHLKTGKKDTIKSLCIMKFLGTRAYIFCAMIRCVWSLVEVCTLNCSLQSLDYLE